MSEAPQIEIYESDELTLVDTKWLTKNGHGSISTINRKLEKQEFPKPIQPECRSHHTPRPRLLA